MSAVLGLKLTAFSNGTTTGRMPRALLAGRLGHQLLDPVAQAVTGLIGEHELVDAMPVGDAQGDAEPQRGVVPVVGGEVRLGRLRLVQQLADRRAGQAARHQPEGGEGGVAATDIRVGTEDPVTRLGGLLVER